MNVPKHITPTNNKSTRSAGRTTKQQLEILKLIYGFRFVSTKHVQALLGKQHLQQAQQRLTTLLAKGLIGRNFSSKDRLSGKFASHYLLPPGMKMLKQYGTSVDKQVLHNIYKDKTASERFIRHQMGLGDVYMELKRLYDDELEFLTKSHVTGAFDYDYEDDPENGHWYDFLPQPLPDVCGSLFVDSDDTREYFLEYVEDTVPFFVYRNRIKFYVEYIEEGSWQENMFDLPTILLVCESPTLERRTKRFLKRYLQDVQEEGLVFKTTNKDKLGQAKIGDNVWEKFLAGGEN